MSIKILLAVAAVTVVSSGATTLNFTEFSWPGSANSYVSGINDSGQLVGTDTFGAGLQGTPGSVTPVTFPGQGQTSPTAINESGLIVGSYYSGTNHGFLDNSGAFTTINDPSAVNGTVARGINASGTVAGSYTDGSGNDHGFIDVAGSYTTLDVPGAVFTDVYGINDNGVVVGQYWAGGFSNVESFTYSAGTFTFVSDPYNGFYATSINNAGDIVGFSGAFDHGILIQGGVFSLFDAPGSVITRPNGINNNGVIAGTYIDSYNQGHSYGFTASTGDAAAPEPASVLLVAPALLILGVRWLISRARSSRAIGAVAL